jgi:Tetracyclin repressor-like, C-terminal domain
MPYSLRPACGSSGRLSGRRLPDARIRLPKRPVRAFCGTHKIHSLPTTSSPAPSAPLVEDLIAVTLGLTASLWQLSHPTDTLKQLYEEVPRWGHAALNFETRLTRLLEATATGLVATGQLASYNAS